MRLILRAVAAILGVLALALTVFYLELPPVRPPARATAVPADEQAALVAALKPPRRARPVVAVLGHNSGTETTDYLVPFAVLTHADVADVHAIATGPGPLRMFPALTLEVPATVADFDVRVPDGADYVIVPQMDQADPPVVLDFIRRQRAKGATIVGICAGARVVAAAGLLAGRRGTSHWFYASEVRRRAPTLTWVSDRRYVAGDGVVTTTGVSASVPVSLAMVEAIAGRERAEAVARELGVAAWDAAHDSAAFGLDRRAIRTVLGNLLAFWRRETHALAVAPGVDEIALAFTADAWSRTYRSRAVTVAPAPVVTRHGLKLLPDRADANGAVPLPALAAGTATRALDTTLGDIAARYGQPTAAFVANQLEYHRPH